MRVTKVTKSSQGETLSNQYTKLSKNSILRKVNRKKNPVRTITQLAAEFGQHTTYTRSNGFPGHAAPGAFRKRVKALVGEKVYNKIRDERFVNIAYR